MKKRLQPGSLGRAYLAGKMRGVKLFNFPAFMRAAKRLRNLGYEVFNPAERDIKEGFDPAKGKPKSLAHYMEHDLAAVCRSQVVFVLPGWESSTGARIEVYVAKALGIPVIEYATMRQVDATVLEEANRLVYGERNASYGHPADDFSCSAAILRALVKRRYGVDVPFTADFVGLFMACGVKGSREAGLHGRDNCVDGPGYWATIQRIHDERPEVLDV